MINCCHINFFFFSFTISKVSEARWLMKFKNEILTKKLIVLPQHREFRTLCIIFLVQKWVTLLLIVCLRSKLVRTSAEWNGWIFAQDYSFVNATKIDGEFIPTPAAYMLIFFSDIQNSVKNYETGSLRHHKSNYVSRPCKWESLHPNRCNFFLRLLTRFFRPNTQGEEIYRSL